jgi:FdhD protein
LCLAQQTRRASLFKKLTVVLSGKHQQPYMVNTGSEDIYVQRVSLETAQEDQDYLAVEEPLEISLLITQAGVEAERKLSVTMRTPGDDIALATGFLFTEGIVHSPAQIAGVRQLPSDPNRICIVLAENFVPELSGMERNFYTTSSCGVCGKSSVEAVRTVSAYQLERQRFELKKQVLFGLPQALRKQQALFVQTGGLHASALFTPDGTLLQLAEDVGRHNALDKLLGKAFQSDKMPLSNSILLLSGRASFELIQKAAMAGIPIVASVGAPSSLAVALAKEHAMILMGFVKEKGCNVYSGMDRISWCK